MYGDKRKAGGDVSKDTKVPKLHTDDKPWSSPNRRMHYVENSANISPPLTSQEKGKQMLGSSKKSNALLSASNDTSRKSSKYGNVASVKRRLISPKEKESLVDEKEKNVPVSPRGNSVTSRLSSLQHSPPHLRKTSFRSPVKTSPFKGTSNFATPKKSPLRRTIRSPTRTFSPQRSAHKWKTPNKSRECSPYKLRSPHPKLATPGNSKQEDELNLSSDAGLEHLKLLSEQLSSLNQDSGALTTALYKSDHRKQTPDKSKRTGKFRQSDKNRTPLKHPVASTSRKSVSPKDNVNYDDDDMWDSCDRDDSAELNIAEPDLDLEAVLDSQADKNKLTVKNVKNILHHVITNEHVVAMVRSRLLQEDPTDKSFEPKMTRSKVKEIMETGQLPHPWPISPIKKKEKEKPVTIMELLFTDEEDDEYDPQKEPPVCDSDDSESFISSSQTSEYGSPCPTTPSTPKVSFLAKDEITPKAKSSTPGQPIPSPQAIMGPPLPPWHSLSNLGKRLNEIAATEDEETIATRTRSKLPLTDTPLDEIELNFVAPDITPDLYDTQIDDKEWGCFLTGLMKTGDQDLNDTLDDEQNDPEYNFLAEEEYDDEDEMRDDRAVKVSKKELNELLDELFEAYGGADILDDDEANETIRPSYNVPAPMKLNETQKAVVMVEVEQEERRNDMLEMIPEQIPVITASEKQQLDDQMRKHAQLLLQVGVLASDTPGLESSSNTCRFLLNELQRFANHPLAGPQSVFNSFNLTSANVSIQSYTRVMSEETPSEDSSSPKSSGKKAIGHKAPRPAQLDTRQKRWFALNPACVYPKILPVVKFTTPDENDKIVFTDAEHNLLALAVAEFQHMTCYIRLIHLYTMPAKTENQIKIHIKNKIAKRALDNPIKQAKVKKITPKFPCVVDPFDPNYPMLPIDHQKEDMPHWLQKMKKLETWKILRKERQYARKKQQRIDKKMALKISNIELNDNVRENLRKKKGTPLSPGVRTRRMSKKDTIKSTVMAKITTRGARKKLSETFGTSYEDIDLTQEASTSQAAASREEDEESFELESLHDETGSCHDEPVSISDVSMDSTTSSDGDSDSDGSRGAATTKKNDLTQTDAAESNPPLRKILPAGGNSLIQLPVLTVSVIPHGPTLGSEAETSTPQQVANHPIPVAVQPIQAYMQAADADPPVAPMLQAVMPAAEAMQPQVPIVAEAGGSNDLHVESLQLPVLQPAENKSPEDVQLNEASPRHPNLDQSLPLRSPAGSKLFVTARTTSQTPPPPGTPPGISPPASTSSPSLLLTPSHVSVIGFVTPSKKCYQPLAPKTPSSSSGAKVSPLIDKPGLQYRGHPSHSPNVKRRLVNRPIKPKGIIINAYISPSKSPTKKAADSIKARLRRKPRPILPKRLQIQVLQDSARSAMVTPPPDGFSDEDYGSEDEGENEPVSSHGADEATSDFLDSENEVGDSQGEDEAEDDHLAELMAASTTISTKRQRKNPLMEKRALTDAVLASNIVESDPLREDRDTAFARAYLNRVKSAMKNDPESFEKFVQILAEFGEDGEKSPVQLYPDVCELLKPYPDLLPDFSTFLSPGEALECGCSTDAEEYHRARTFLRKLEVHFQKHPNFFQKIVKALDTCRNGATEKLQDLQELMKSLLRGQPHLLEEFMAFFSKDKPPNSRMTDFEEVTLEFSDDEPTEYETVKLPVKESGYGTSRCGCSCHGSSGSMRRKMHCRKCALTIIDGQLCLMTKNRAQGGAATVVFNKQSVQDLDEDSRHSGLSGLSRRASLDSLGPGLSDIENIEEGGTEPQRRKRAYGNHKVLAELTDSSDQASNDNEPGYFGLDNLPRNNVNGAVDEEEDDDDVDDVDDDDLDDDDDEDVLADDEDDNNDDKDDVDEDDVADDLDDIDDSDDNIGNNEDSDVDDEDDDFDPSAYIEEEENEENQSSEATESPDNKKTECAQNVNNKRRISNENGANRTDGLCVTKLPESSDKVVTKTNSECDASSGVDETDGSSEGFSESGEAQQKKNFDQVDGASNLKEKDSTSQTETNLKRYWHDTNSHLKEQSSSTAWTREEDTMILETCKHCGPTLRSFRLVSHKLKNRTTEQVSERFNHLLERGTGVGIR